METVNVKIGSKTFELLTARTPKEREKGLSGRKTIPADGMIFFHDEPSRHGYWMKDTPIPLSFLFVGPDKTITDVKHRKPNSLSVSRPSQPALFVIELPRNKGFDSLKGETIKIMNSPEDAAKQAFTETVKSAEIPEPLPEDFLQKVLRLPKPKRDQAIQAKLEDFGASMRQEIKNNISSALSDIRKEKIESQADELLSMIEGE